jgi:hypothetical protein
MRPDLFRLDDSFSCFCVDNFTSAITQTAVNHYKYIHEVNVHGKAVRREDGQILHEYIITLNHGNGV